jgi:two-component system sensor histidine kinase HydH
VPPALAPPPVSRPRSWRVYSPDRERTGAPVRPTLGRWVRWGWLATTAVMAAALLMMAWLGVRRAQSAAATLNRGQSLVLLEAARQRTRALTAPPDAAEAESLLAEHESVGLRYVGFFDSDGVAVAEAGHRLGLPLPRDLSPRPFAIEELHSRIRLFSFAPIGRAPEPPPEAGRAGPGGPPRPEPAERARARPHALAMVLEFEPVVAERLAAEAMRTFLLSAMVTAALIAAAFIFWRLSIRQEVTERRLEQQRRLGALGEMSAVLAHELRNPLASLKGHAQLLVERLGAGTAEGRKAELVVSESQRLEALTGDLLDFARSGPIDRRPVDPVALLQACVHEVAPEGFDVRVGTAPRTWSLDEGRMRQALTNILRNAHQASPNDGRRPEVAIAADGGALVVTVRDFGAGIPAGDEKRIFSPVYTTRTSGTGLGLAVALRVAEMHGGSVTAATHPDGGAVFRMAIPRS